MQLELNEQESEKIDRLAGDLLIGAIAARRHVRIAEGRVNSTVERTNVGDVREAVGSIIVEIVVDRHSHAFLAVREILDDHQSPVEFLRAGRKTRGKIVDEVFDRQLRFCSIEIGVDVFERVQRSSARGSVASWPPVDNRPLVLERKEKRIVVELLQTAVLFGEKNAPFAASMSDVGHTVKRAKLRQENVRVVGSEHVGTGSRQGRLVAGQRRVRFVDGQRF